MKTEWLAGAAVLLLSATQAPAAFADEGMWTFDNFPAAKVKEAYGVTIVQPRLVDGHAIGLLDLGRGEVVEGPHAFIGEGGGRLGGGQHEHGGAGEPFSLHAGKTSPEGLAGQASSP